MSKSTKSKAPKQRFFVPGVGVSVEATDITEAVKLAAESKAKQESGDGR